MSDYFGLYQGAIHDINDPEDRGRVRALVPQVLGDSPSGWAEPMLPTAGTVVWAVGDRVWVLFEGGDLNKPVYLSRPAIQIGDIDPSVLEGIVTADRLIAHNALIDALQ